MAVTLQDSGTTTPTTLGVEQTLVAAITAAGVYQLVIEVTNLADGETLTLNFYEKTLTGGTERLSDTVVVQNAQTDLMKRSIPYASDISWRVGIRQDGGTLRAYNWKVLKIG